jgi:hypothetical protein
MKADLKTEAEGVLEIGNSASRPAQHAAGRSRTSIHACVLQLDMRNDFTCGGSGTRTIASNCEVSNGAPRAILIP